MAADQWSGLFWMKWQKLNSLSLLGIEPLLSSPDNSVFLLRCNSSRHDMCTERIVTEVLQITDQLSAQKTSFPILILKILFNQTPSLLAHPT